MVNDGPLNKLKPAYSLLIQYLTIRLIKCLIRARKTFERPIT